jgi:hypothetical protein
MEEMPMTRHTTALPLIVLCLGLSACSDSPSGPSRSQDSANALAEAMLGGAEVGMMGAIPGRTIDVDVAADCPAGGRRAISGQTTATHEDNAIAVTWDLVMTHHDCAVDIREWRIVTNGSIRNRGSNAFIPPAKAGERPTVLRYESHQTGEASTMTDGRTITCTIDLVQTYDPGARTMRLVGNSCGRPIDITRPVP